MTFPTIAATNSGNSGANTTSHTINLPAGIVAGNLLVVGFENDGTATASVTTPASGWTNIANVQNGTNHRLNVWRRVADGSEGGTITVTTSASEGSSHVSARITGVHASTIPEIATLSSGSTTPNPPSLNPTNWDVEDTLWLALTSWDGNIAHSAYPTNYTLGQVTNRWANSNGGGFAMAGRNNAAASEDPGTFTLASTANWVAATIAIRPGAGTFTGTSALSVGAATLSGSATFSAGTKTATAALTAPRATLAGSAEFDPPVYTGTAVLLVGEATLTGTAVTVQTFTATAALTAPRATLASSAEFDAPVYTASASLTAGGAILSSLATFSDPIYAAAGNLTVGRATLSGSATFSPPVFTASAGLTVGRATLAGSALFAGAIYSASAALTAPAATLQGTASLSIEGVSAVAVLVIAPATLVGSSVFMFGTPKFSTLGRLRRGGSVAMLERPGPLGRIQVRGL